MTKREMCVDSALPETQSGADKRLADRHRLEERRLKYKTLAVAFSYPDDNFFKFFPEFISEKENLRFEYDRLFRSNEVWLYGSEYKAENEFQRVNDLSDISGFYKAFGVNSNKDRPDSLACELEFMYYLIFKLLYLLKKNNIEDRDRKANVCSEAQKKFFNEHLYPAAKKIADNIILKTKNRFYSQAAKELTQFLKAEKAYLEEG